MKKYLKKRIKKIDKLLDEVLKEECKSFETISYLRGRKFELIMLKKFLKKTKQHSINTVLTRCES